MSTQKKPSVIETVFGIIGVVVAVFAVGAAVFFLKGEKVYEERVDFAAGEAHFQFSLPGEEPGYRLFLVTKLRYDDDFRYRLWVRLITPSGAVIEDELNDMETIVDANTTETTRHVLFEIPPEEGSYDLTVTLEELSGDVTIETVKVEVRER